MRVLLSAAQRWYANAFGLVGLIGICCWSPAGGQTEVLRCLSLPPPTLLLIGWINLEGNLTRSRIPPKLTIGIVFYICPQERQMLSLSTTSTFEYPYFNTMTESTKGICFGGQGRCIILAAKTHRRRLCFWCCEACSFSFKWPLNF